MKYLPEDLLDSSFVQQVNLIERYLLACDFFHSLQAFWMETSGGITHSC